MSTILFVPGLIVWLTDVCEKMTERRTKADFDNTKAQKTVQQPQADTKQPTELNRLRTDNLSMAGFMKK